MRARMGIIYLPRYTQREKWPKEDDVCVRRVRALCCDFYCTARTQRNGKRMFSSRRRLFLSMCARVGKRAFRAG